MYLYNLKNGKIEVYSMIPNKSKIYKFRKSELETIRFNNRVLKALTNSLLLFDNRHIDDCFIDSYVYKKATFFDRQYHDLVSSNTTQKVLEYRRINNLLDRYYNDEIEYKIPIRIYNSYLKNETYLLLTNSKYCFVNNKKNLRIMDNIIYMTEDLYSLELLLKEKIPNINDKNLKKIISLFDISLDPKYLIDIEDLKKAEESRIIDFDFKKTMDKVNESQKILTLIKK